MPMTIDGNGTITGLSAGGLPDASITTNDIANSSVTPSKLSQPLTLETAKSATSTAVDFTGIPSWVKRITVMLNGISLSGTASILIQLGTSGTPTTTGYVSTSAYMTTPNGAGTVGGINTTSGFGIQAGASAYVLYGSIIFTNVSGNIWVAQGCFANTASVGLSIVASGVISLSGTLNMARITSTTGTDTFDAGTINILYE